MANEQKFDANSGGGVYCFAHRGVGGCRCGCQDADPAASSPSSTDLVDPETEDSVAPCCPPNQEERSAAPPAQPADRSQTDRADSLPDPLTPARAGPWIEPNDREAFDLDFKMTDQDGQSLVLSDLVGFPIAMSFIFTRCPNPNLCPVITLAMAQLQRDLEAAGLDQEVRLLLMTYDPVYDTPPRLRKYGEDRGLQFTHAMMLQPDPDQFRRLLEEFQIGVDYRADGSIGHFIELILIDDKGRFVRDYQGQIWDNAAVLADLKRLVVQQERASTGG